MIFVIVLLCVGGGAALSARSSPTRYLGSAAGRPLNKPVVGITATRSGNGYWLVASDGGVFTFGSARYYGSTGALRLNAPVVGIAATPTGRGYRLVASDGGVFNFGDARFYGSTGALRLHSPIAGIAATPSGRGYWLVASDGGVFAFGDARFYGSAVHNRNRTARIVGIAPSPRGRGYWLVGANGSVFAYGDAGFHGSGAAQPLGAPVVGIAPTPSGHGYWLAESDGGTLAFGDARPWGTQFGSGASTQVVNIASSTHGYWVAARDGAVGVSHGKPAAVRPSGSRAIVFELLVRMNRERAARNLAPLTWNPLLGIFANSWAHTLLDSGQFHHQNLGTIINASNGGLEQAGENIFSGAGTGADDAGTAHSSLMHSSEHRANMLLPQGQLVGIGAACRGDKLVVVEDFGIRMGAPLPPPSAPVPSLDPVVSADQGGAHC